MIRFACVYCGVTVAAQEAQACRLAKCPACGHRLRVPRVDVAQPPSAGDVGDPPLEAEVSHREPEANADRWAGMSDKQIAKALLKKPLTPEQKQRQATRRALRPLMPQYDNLTLFALSAAFVGLGLTGSISLAPPAPVTADSSLADWFAAFAHELADQFAGLFFLAAVGMVVSLFSVFWRGPKPRSMKFFMLSFGILATGGTGIYAGFVILEQVHAWPMMIFPLWNILNGAVLVVLFHTGLMDPDCVVDRRPTAAQVAVTVVAISLLLGVCRYALHLHWAIAYSICVCYTMSLNHSLHDVFGIGAEPLTTWEADHK